MTTYFVTRHPGARQWAEEEGLAVDEVVVHFDVACVQAGDSVIGSLPVNLAGEVCALGARYFHLSLSLAAEQRGEELTSEQMRDAGAKIEEYKVERLG